MPRKYVHKISSRYSLALCTQEWASTHLASRSAPRGSLSSLRLIVDFSKLTIQRFTVDTERVSCLILVPARLLEDLTNVFFFHFVQPQSPLSGIIKHAPIATSFLNGEREIVRKDLVAPAQCDGPLDRILQFPYIAGPGIIHQHR